MLIQILITIFAVAALIGTFFRFRKADIGRGEFLIWIILWLGVLALVWNPAATNVIASWLGVGRGADAVFYVAIVFLFYAVFRLYGKQENLEHKLSELVKKIALKDFKNIKQQESDDGKRWEE